MENKKNLQWGIILSYITMFAAGAVVIEDVENGVTVAGVPAKVINKGAMLG